MKLPSSFDATIIGRFASVLIVPLMDNLYLDTFYFNVPPIEEILK